MTVGVSQIRHQESDHRRCARGRSPTTAIWPIPIDRYATSTRKTPRATRWRSPGLPRHADQHRGPAAGEILPAVSRRRDRLLSLLQRYLGRRRQYLSNSTTRIRSRNVWILEGRVRYYKQNSANFYSDLFPPADYAKFRRPRPEFGGLGQHHDRRQGHLRVPARRLEGVQARHRHARHQPHSLQLLDFRNIKYYGVPQYPPGD